jgi:hypoxanthine phosphoribosyltransferase
LKNSSEFEKVVYENKFRTLISADEIEIKIQELGKEITEDYRDKNPIMIGVLNGGFLFMADLIRHVEIDLEIDFIKISSYGDATVSSGKVTMLKDINAEIAGRHILLVEDIVDTGLSVQYLKSKFLELKPASLKFVSLLRKKENAKVDYDVEYVGFDIANEFVVGYGLDHKQILRNLPAVYVMD